MSKYINPYTDFGFKRLFGSEGNKNLETFDDIPQILNEPFFGKAFRTAELAAMSEMERLEYEQSKLVFSELKSAMDTSKEEGAFEERFKIAKMMKDKGELINKIIEYTGLTKEGIEKL